MTIAPSAPATMRGSWNGLPTDNANAYTIGMECAATRYHITERP